MARSSGEFKKIRQQLHVPPLSVLASFRKLRCWKSMSWFPGSLNDAFNKPMRLFLHFSADFISARLLKHNRQTTCFSPGIARWYQSRHRPALRDLSQLKFTYTTHMQHLLPQRSCYASHVFLSSLFWKHEPGADCLSYQNTSRRWSMRRTKQSSRNGTAALKKSIGNSLYGKDSCANLSKCSGQQCMCFCFSAD